MTGNRLQGKGLGGVFPLRGAHALRKPVRGTDPVPEARREHGAHALHNGAEKPLPHPQRKRQLLGGQERLIVKHVQDGLKGYILLPAAE